MGTSVSPQARSLKSLCRTIEGCEQCPRLVRWRTQIAREKVKRFSDWTYWGKPVTGFGDPRARLMIVGLAPAAHGANRTGRMFTGDRSGKWLYRALYHHGFANQERSEHRDDGLRLTDCYITAACRCAPPQNKPTTRELQTCRPFLLNEMNILSTVSVVIGLGRIGYYAAFDTLTVSRSAHDSRRPVFSHGVHTVLGNNLHLLGSYHPSQQNTFTGRLTERMFNAVFNRARFLLRS